MIQITKIFSACLHAVVVVPLNDFQQSWLSALSVYILTAQWRGECINMCLQSYIGEGFVYVIDVIVAAVTTSLLPHFWRFSEVCDTLIIDDDRVSFHSRIHIYINMALWLLKLLEVDLVQLINIISLASKTNLTDFDLIITQIIYKYIYYYFLFNLLQWIDQTMQKVWKTISYLLGIVIPLFCAIGGECVKIITVTPASAAPIVCLRSITIIQVCLFFIWVAPGLGGESKDDLYWVVWAGSTVRF